MKRLLCAGILLIAAFSAAAENLPEPVAWIGGVPLKAERFVRLRLPAGEPQRSAALKKAVEVEVYLYLVNELLNLSGIVPGENTARRYLEFRSLQSGGKLSNQVKKQLSSLLQNRDFQLKSALFFIFYAADRASVEPSETELNDFYFRNRKRYHIPEKRELTVFRAGENSPKGEKRAADARAFLRQGESFQSVAARFSPEGVRPDTVPGLWAQIQSEAVKLPEGGTGEVKCPAGIYFFQVKKIIPEKVPPFEEIRDAVREELSSIKLSRSLEQYIREELRKRPLKLNFISRE